MRFYWVHDRHRQKQFHVHWKQGQENLVDYPTKHHSAKHHISVRPTYVLNNLRRNPNLKPILPLSTQCTRNHPVSPSLHTISVLNQSRVQQPQPSSPSLPPMRKHELIRLSARTAPPTQSHCKGVLNSIPVNGKSAWSRPLTSRYGPYLLQINNDIANDFKQLLWIPSQSKSRKP